jgi:hypothetical protein
MSTKESNESKKNKKQIFKILNQEQREKEVWVELPGADIEFCIKKSKINDERVLAMLYEKASKDPENANSVEVLNKSVEFCVKYTIDYRGDALKDYDGNPIPYTPENLQEFLTAYAYQTLGDKVYSPTLGKKVEMTLILWLITQIRDVNNFIKGDSKNLKAS